MHNVANRARILKLLRSLGIDFTESIPCENQFRSRIGSREGKGAPDNVKAYSIPYLVPTQFQESIFLPITRPKIKARDAPLLSPDQLV